MLSEPVNHFQLASLTLVQATCHSFASLRPDSVRARLHSCDPEVFPKVAMYCLDSFEGVETKGMEEPLIRRTSR